MERAFDIIFCFIALLLLTPLLIIVIVILRFTGEGEIFFSQERIGVQQKKFKLLKFVTMLKDSPNMASGTVTMKNDFRVLPFGRVLRKTKINELPQLFNVLMGDMSLVGPRPMTPQTFSAYNTATQEIIQNVKPGLSGIGSIIFRSEEDLLTNDSASVNYYNTTIAPFKGALEVWFVENKSLKLYMIIVFLTIWVVVSRNNRVVWRWLRDLPVPPNELKTKLGFQ